jgi:hypothetical protein
VYKCFYYLWPITTYITSLYGIHSFSSWHFLFIYIILTWQIFRIIWLQTSLVIASDHQILYVILVLHLIASLISENTFLWHLASASIIFVTVAVFGAIFIFQSPKPLLQHSLLIGLITATFFFITLHLRIFWNFSVFRTG